MSCNYADGLSPYDDKGVLGLPERFDTQDKFEEKAKILSDWIKDSKHVVFHTGAGISTSAGIPDFRGPNGVWTLEKKGEKPSINISFDDAKPTKTHMALVELIKNGYVKYVVSQNIDGLHLKSGISRTNLAELHGNMFVNQCITCNRQFVSKTATTSVGQKCLDLPCAGIRGSGRKCRGKLYDTILDWEANLPEDDLLMSEYQSTIADLNVCLGTTLQIVPSGNLPLLSCKYGGRVVIINLQPTKHDKKADLIINGYVDEVISRIMANLGLEIPEYNKLNDPTKNNEVVGWTITENSLKSWRKLYNSRCQEKRKQKVEKNKNFACKKFKKFDEVPIKEETNNIELIDSKVNSAIPTIKELNCKQEESDLLTNNITKLEYKFKETVEEIKIKSETLNENTIENHKLEVINANNQEVFSNEEAQGKDENKSSVNKEVFNEEHLNQMLS